VPSAPVVHDTDADRASRRSYLQSVYREPLEHVSDTQVRRRATRAVWVYHDLVQRLGFNASCVALATDWRRRSCAQTDAASRALVLPANLLMRKFNWYGAWRPAPMRGACGASFEPAFSRDNAWVEVLRLGRDFEEGGLKGCWFLGAPGSGVFINTGVSLRANNRSHLAHIFGLNLSASGRKFLNWNPWRLEHNTRVCEYARDRGYATIQIGWEGCRRVGSSTDSIARSRDTETCFHEIVSCQPECLALPTPCSAPRQHQSTCARVFCPRCCRTCSEIERRAYLEWNETHWPPGPCVHSSMLRTGWNASAACVCDDSLPLLNCLGSSPEIAPPTSALHSTHNARTSEYVGFLNRTPPCNPRSRNAWHSLAQGRPPMRHRT